MKICFMCDLHLPFDKNAMQYDVLKWAVEDILCKKPDCIAFAGDVTCDGNEEVYEYFVAYMKKTGIPFLFIPGNSDLRDVNSKQRLQSYSSEFKNVIKGITVYAVNDSNKIIDSEVCEKIALAEENSIVFMHHPPENCLSQAAISKRGLVFFYGHLHRFEAYDNFVSLPALDPDKSIGESPCMIYYETETKEIEKSCYPSELPADLPDYFGISCYNSLKQIRFAADNKLKFLELRPDCVNISFDELSNAIDIWRKICGENLSIHLPDVGFSDGKVVFSNGFDEAVSVVKLLKADRVTLHVPDISVGVAKKPVLEEICKLTAAKLNVIEHNIVVGIENMHMTPVEKPDEHRRFGYTPEECISFMKLMSAYCKHKTGINFDIGHARNNAPFSQKYQIGTWMSMVGKYIVGYHLHQVTQSEGRFCNHMPITSVYGNLISFASFFKNWEKCKINKAPVIFEMRPEGAYEITLKVFHKN